MSKRVLIIFIVVVLFMAVFLGSTMAAQTTEVGGSYDTAYYVEDSGNIFIKLAKVLDKSCYYVVDMVISGISSIFNAILGS